MRSNFIRKKHVVQESFTCIKVYIPNGTAKIIKEKSRESATAMSRLCAIAIDNELDATVPFNYPCELPTSNYIENEYLQEATKLYQFVKGFREGTGIDTMMLCRRDIGIEDKDILMFCFRELLEQNMLLAYTPKVARFDDSTHKRYIVQPSDKKDIGNRDWDNPELIDWLRNPGNKERPR